MLILVDEVQLLSSKDKEVMSTLNSLGFKVVVFTGTIDKTAKRELNYSSDEVYSKKRSETTRRTIYQKKFSQPIGQARSAFVKEKTISILNDHVKKNPANLACAFISKESLGSNLGLDINTVLEDYEKCINETDNDEAKLAVYLDNFIGNVGANLFKTIPANKLQTFFKKVKDEKSVNDQNKKEVLKKAFIKFFEDESIISNLKSSVRNKFSNIAADSVLAQINIDKLYLKITSCFDKNKDTQKNEDIDFSSFLIKRPPSFKNIGLGDYSFDDLDIKTCYTAHIEGKQPTDQEVELITHLKVLFSNGVGGALISTGPFKTGFSVERVNAVIVDPLDLTVGKDRKEIQDSSNSYLQEIARMQIGRAHV